MKFLSILAAASLALIPAVAGAGSSDDGTDDSRPISSPLAGHVIDRPAIPIGAIIVGSLVIFGGVIIGVLAGNDPNNNTN